MAISESSILVIGHQAMTLDSVFPHLYFKDGGVTRNQ